VSKVYNSRDPVLFATVSDGVNTVRCDDAEISNTYLRGQPTTPVGALAELMAGTVSFERNKTEIECAVKAPLRFPARVYLVTIGNDTVSAYDIKKE
jgi:hypothetical protein